MTKQIELKEEELGLICLCLTLTQQMIYENPDLGSVAARKEKLIAVQRLIPKLLEELERFNK